jgi:beta-glucosidase
MNKILIASATALLLFSGFSINDKGYQNSDLPVDQRVELLMSQMTLSEKIAQMQYYAYNRIERFVDKDGNISLDTLSKYFPYGMGGFNLGIDLSPEAYLTLRNTVQKYNLTRHAGIPVAFIAEGLHGAMLNSATVFPQAIALGCTWDTVLLEELYTATALEGRKRGVVQFLSPVLDLGRDPRFGRIEEMYSEDPYLVAQMSKAAVWGFQGRTNMPDNNHLAATLKHFMGHGFPEGGRNTAPLNLSPYDMLNDHFYPFYVCINEAHPASVMPSYNEFNGMPNHGSKWLLDNILRKEAGFKGFITSDQDAITEMWRQHAVVPDEAQAAKLSLLSGISIDITYSKGSYSKLEELVKSGEISEEVINQHVRQILTFKFKMGLFEHPYENMDEMKAINNCKAHKQIAYEAACKSMVLLKNANHLLPLDSTQVKTIAVIGPNAKGVHFGGYTVEPRNGIDPFDGISHFANGRFKVVYAEGCKISRDPGSFWGNTNPILSDPNEDQILIKEAVKLAKQSDVIVLVIGENESFCREGWSEAHRGDRESLELLGAQNDLVKEMLKTGKPVVVVLFNGRPLTINYVAENVPAIIEGWYAGEETGTALADILFGKVNPSGKLSVTFPKSTGELPCYYDRKPTRARSYLNVDSQYLYPFGYGLSYSTFEYSNLKIDKTEMSANESVTVSFTVKNTSQRTGDEVVQLYIRDKVSSGVRPMKELKDFARVTLAAGESKTLHFVVTAEKLKFYNYELKRVAEPGDFEVMVGGNSESLLKTSFTLK